MRSPAGYHLPTLSKINKIIVITCTVFFILHHILLSLGAFSIARELGLSTSGLMSGKIYQLVTYPFVETQFMSFLFNLLMVWFMGSEFENSWGQKIYLKFLVLVVLIPGITFALLGISFGNVSSIPLIGLTGINFAFCLAQATLNPERVFSFFFIFPLRAIHFCGILILIEVYSAIVGGQLINSLIHLESMLIGFCVIKFQRHPFFKLYFQGYSSGSQSKKRASTPAGHLKLVKKDEEKDPPKYWH